MNITSVVHILLGRLILMYVLIIWRLADLKGIVRKVNKLLLPIVLLVILWLRQKILRRLIVGLPISI